jgi:hypothetical protein
VSLIFSMLRIFHIHHSGDRTRKCLAN